MTKIAYEQDYAHDGRLTLNEENAFDELSADIKECYGPQFKLLKINQLEGPGGGWPDVVIMFEGNEEDFYNILCDDGGLDREDVDAMIIEKSED